MRIADVIGTVTLSRSLPEFEAARLRLLVPVTLRELQHDLPATADCLVAWDEFSSGLGDRVAISEGAEAAQPFRPDLKPIDCYVAAILDNIDLDVPPSLQ